MKVELERDIQFIHPDLGSIETNKVVVCGRLFWGLFKPMFLPREVYVMNSDVQQKILAIGYLNEGEVKRDAKGNLQIISIML